MDMVYPGPCTVPIQPVPVKTIAARFTDAAGPKTSIYRRFREGEAALCRLCPPSHCGARGDECLIIVNVHVPRGEAKLFSTRDTPGFLWQDGSELDLAHGPTLRHVREVPHAVVPVDEREERP